MVEFDWDALSDPPLTDVHRAYAAAFDDWLRADDEDRFKHRKRLDALLALMRLDKPGVP